ncbi:MAG: cation-translocating P-type ATPase [Anaerolineae bacterium]|nr:cation-translocating P-type ATPase [Anaerolineae bacterium]
MDRFVTTCATCVRGVRTFTNHYRSFLLDPGTLFTAFSGLLLLIAIALNPAEIISEQAPQTNAQWVYLAAALVGSSYIWWSAIQGIREGDFTADIPVSLATLAAILIGEYAAAAVVAVLLLLGGMLEEFVAARAGHALEDLARLLPDRVTVRKPEGDMIVPLDAVQVGDTILVRPGERLAVDGEVLSGSALLNQAAITGESLSVEKNPGDKVYAGTLNENGALEVCATQIGERTTLGKIRRMVLEAQENKAPIERILNRYAKFYTPAAILLGLILWAVTGDVLRAITVLIVFCPCVMVLATPTALVASIGNAALRGSLVKRGATIESLAKVTTIIFDKTGTLTSGRPRLVQVVSVNGLPSSEVLRLSAVAEKFSEHPLGKSVVQAAQEKRIEVIDPDSFDALPGFGVQARIGATTVLLGKPQLLASQGITLAPEMERQIASATRTGQTVILTAVNQQISGLLLFEDTIRPESKPMLARLQEIGLRTILLTGDHQQTAKRVAEELGIREVYAGVLPHEKVELVQKVQQERQVVAFVGDGINDGPALATADVGIAMGFGGTDLAIETAEISLLSDDLSRLPHLIHLSRQAMRAIRQNLAFSLGVLAIAVLLTIAGILTPVTGALLHELSSIPVIANSARLIGLRSDN